VISYCAIYLKGEVNLVYVKSVFLLCDGVNKVLFLYFQLKRVAQISEFKGAA